MGRPQSEERAIYTAIKLSKMKRSVDLLGTTLTGVKVDSNQTVAPETDGGADLGTSAIRYANIYCNDLNLANDRGDWTLVEEAEYLSLRNNNTGKTYKIVMEEIEGGE